MEGQETSTGAGGEGAGRPRREGEATGPCYRAWAAMSQRLTRQTGGRLRERLMASRPCSAPQPQARGGHGNSAQARAGLHSQVPTVRSESAEDFLMPQHSNALMFPHGPSRPQGPESPFQRRSPGFRPGSPSLAAHGHGLEGTVMPKEDTLEGPPSGRSSQLRPGRGHTTQLS